MLKKKRVEELPVLVLRTEQQLQHRVKQLLCRTDLGQWGRGDVENGNRTGELERDPHRHAKPLSNK